MAELTVQIDPQEVRILTDRLGLLVTGAEDDRLQWDLENSLNVGVDDATFTGVLAPAWMISTWYTSARTDYLVRKADTDKAASSSWVEKNLGFNGNIYLHSLGVNEVVTTIATYEKNMPWWVSYYAYGQGDHFAQFEIRYGDSPATDVNLLFWTDNTVHIYKAGVFIGTVNLTQSKAWERAQRASEGGSRNNNQDRPIDLFIMPCRRREILIWSSVGGLGNFVFEDIEKDDPDPTILPAGQVSFYVSDGQATFQAAPAKKAAWSGNFFATSGYLLSKVLEMRQAPAAGATATVTAFYDLPYYDTDPVVTPSLVDVDGTTSFVGNGVKKQARIKVAMTGDGKNTPFVYGAQAEFARVTTNTANSPTTVDDYLIAASLNVPESPADTTMDLTFKNQPALTALVSKVTKISNRPIVAKISTIAILTGRAFSPNWTDMPTNESQKVMLECRDRWASFETKKIADPLPYDDRLLEDVIKELAMSPGYPLADMDVESFGVRLDYRGQASRGEWALIPEHGETVASWLLRLYEDYARTCVMGWYPSATGPKFRFRLPAEFGGTLSMTESSTVYATRAAALAAGKTEANHTRFTYVITSDEEQLPPEANDVRVTGWDRRTDKAFQAHEEDLDSKNAATAVASRPDNWMGEPVEVALWDPGITTQAMANYAAGVMRYRTFKGPRIREWQCKDMQFKTDGSPMWKGDVMYLNEHGRYRILTLSSELIMESPLANVVRDTYYVGERIAS